MEKNWVPCISTGNPKIPMVTGVDLKKKHTKNCVRTTLTADMISKLNFSKQSTFDVIVNIICVWECVCIYAYACCAYKTQLWKVNLNHNQIYHKIFYYNFFLLLLFYSFILCLCFSECMYDLIWVSSLDCFFCYFFQFIIFL